MELLKIFTFCFLCCSASAIGFNNIMEMIHRVRNISKEKLWADNILTQKIIVDNKDVEAKDALKDINDEFLFEKKLNNAQLLGMLAEASKALYTAQKCKYSNLVQNVLVTFFESILSCQNLLKSNLDDINKSPNEIQSYINQVIESTILLKKYIVKFIFNTRNMMKLAPILKSSDHNLLKSLKFINLCLYHIRIYVNKNGSEYLSSISSKIDLKRMFAQMIKVIENFRIKNCQVVDYFEANVYKKIQVNNVIQFQQNVDFRLLLNDMLISLQIYFKDTALFNNYLEKGLIFNEEMYDPKFMLLERILNMSNYSIIPTLLVRWKNDKDWTTLNNVYNNVSETFNLQTIYDYQVFLVEIIKNLFFVKFLNKNTNDIQDLLYAFEEFTNKMLPKNYSTDSYGTIKKVLNSLHDDLRSTSTESTPTLSKRSIELLQKVSIVLTLPDDTTQGYSINGIVDKLSMKNLVSEIINDQSFNIFIETFEELSYESYTLDNYNIYQVNGTDRNQPTIDEMACKNLSTFRKNLLSFHLLTHKFERVVVGFNDTDDSHVENAKMFIFDHVMHLFRSYQDHNKIRQIVLPIIIRFTYTFKNKNDDMLQFLFLHLNLIENVELTNCLSPEYSMDWYHNEISQLPEGQILNQVLRYQQDRNDLLLKKIWTNREKITATIELNTSNYRLAERLRDILSKVINDANFISVSNDITLTHTLRDDSVERIELVSPKLSNSLIDYQYLVEIQCFVIKQIIKEIAESFLRCIQIYDTAKDKNDLIDTKNQITHNYFTQFYELPFLKSLKVHLHDIFHLFDLLFRNLDAENRENNKSDIIKQLELLQPSFYDGLLKDQDILSLHNLIDKYMSFLKSILKPINNSKLISNIPFSTCICV